MTDGDRLLNLVGILLVLAFVAGVVLLVFVGMNSAPSQSEKLPVTNWKVERVNATHVRITHAGGDPVDTEHLIVTVGGNERGASWSKTLFEGDSGLVRVRTGETLKLYWQPNRAADRSLLRSWQV